jgi:integrase
VAARLGHAAIDVTLRTYTHQITPDDRHAADALDRALG